MSSENPHIGLFVTCLVDLMRPSVGFAAVKLLEDAGCRVTVPPGQTCCGQPAYSAGDQDDARALARRVIDQFEGFDYVVVPSGSCAGTIKVHYPELFAGDPGMAEKAREMSERTYELISFLKDVLQLDGLKAEYDGVATYHDSCSGLHELGIKEQPRALLNRVRGLELKESSGAENCCGFGGQFSVKYPEISGRIVDDKVDNIIESGADTLLGGDMGCLLNISGRLKRRGSKIKVRHLAEVLSGMTDAPPIGEGTDGE